MYLPIARAHAQTHTHTHTHTPAPTGGMVTIPEDTFACHIIIHSVTSSYIVSHHHGNHTRRYACQVGLKA